MNSCRRKVKAFLHSTGIEPCTLVRCIHQIDDLEKLVNSLVQRLSVHLLQFSLKSHILTPRQILVNNRILILNPNDLSYLRPIRIHIKPSNRSRTRCLPKQRREYLDGGALTGTVGSQETEQFPL